MIQANPLTCGVAALRRVLYGSALEVPPGVPGLETSIGVTVAFGLAVFLATTRVARSAG